MKSLAALLIAFTIILGVNAQDEEKLSNSELKAMKREQKKAEQAAELEKKTALTDYMISHQKFVLEADYLSDKTGARVSVLSQINFMRADSLNGVVQFGSAMDLGYNGVGGATIEGKINNYKYSKIGKKQDSYSVAFNFMSTLGNYDITLMVSQNGNADCTVKSNSSGVLSYHGTLVPLELSRVYKGHSVY